ncbi:MAG TPA: hypothetical protein VID73_04605 [Ktedonobacterales bacterium]|jgi:hypothetical protein
MNVHRLKLWLARTAHTLQHAWRQAAGRPATVRPRATYSAHAPGSDLASARWLDDARRLRARPGARPRPALPHVSREQLRQIFTDPRWASAYDAAVPPRPPRAPLLGEAHAPQPAAESTDSRPAVPSRPAAASEDQADRERRRLAFIRDLVRRGIYNEGFDATHLPEQYRPRPDAPVE